MRDTFTNVVRKEIIDTQHYYCKRDGCLNYIHSIHHKLGNNKANRGNFPLLIHSVINGVGLCFTCHIEYAHEFNIGLEEARMIENYLGKLKYKRKCTIDQGEQT